MFSRINQSYGEMQEGLQEIFVPYQIIDAPQAAVLSVQGGVIEWRNVTFQFGENVVFSDFSLSIPAGQRVGLVGSSGAGKSTFVSLLLRQHDIACGEILIDGQNIAHVTQDSLRGAIAVVPQEPMLFHRTIRENILYGRPLATENDLFAAARRAQVHDFVRALPDGYDTLVGERGIKLSGGQKQRVAIARAMLKDAPILVLDEATSALDSESEVAIQKALHALMVGKTVIAIAHRLSTLREMDRIIVLENGVIVEDGTHDALVRYGGVYAKLWHHQSGGFLA
jgi:ABC-type multidrug transport system fused ATPase/permease subunit